MMAEEHERMRSRSDRLRAYIAYNRKQMVVDVLVLSAWLIATWTIFGALDFPAWMFYLILFIGVIAYSRLTPPWSRPYRSPDLGGDSEEL